MFKSLLVCLSFFLSLHLPAFASQADTDNIANLSAIPLYNLDKQALKGNIKAYMYSDPELKALKIIEALSGETHIEMHKDDNGVVIEAALPKDLSHFNAFQSEVVFKQEKVGKVFAYFYAKEKLLTDEEQEYLQKHKTINIGTLDYWAPYNFYEFGQPKGYSIELMNLVAQKVGMQINYIPASNLNALLSKTKEAEVSAILGLAQTPQREEFLSFSDIYINVRNAMMVHKDSKSIATFEDLKGKTLALTKGLYYIQYLEKKYPQIKLLFVESELESLKAVSEKKADAVIGSIHTMQYSISKNGLPNLKQIAAYEEDILKSIPLRIGVQKESPLLLSILQKGLSAISEEEINTIKEHWFKSLEKNAFLELSLQEQMWLDRNVKIRYAVDPNWLPLENIDQQTGKHEGIIAEIISKIAQISGLQFELVPTKNFSESNTLLQEGKIDMLASMSKTAKREESFVFSAPLLSISNIVLMRSNEKDIQSLFDLNGKKVGVNEGTSLYQMLTKEYPEIIVVPIKGVPPALEKLSKGEIDAFLGSLEVVGYQINALGLFNLRVVLRLDEKRVLHSAFIKSLPSEAVSIYNKALKTIPPEEIEDIRTKWIGVRSKTDYALFFELALGAFGIGLILFYLNYQLKKRVKEKTAELSALLTSFNTYVISSKTDLKGIITHVSDAFCEISGYKREELIGKPHKIVRHPDMPKSIFKDLWQDLKAEKIWRGEIKNRKKDGGYYWVDAIITPEYNLQGKLYGYGAIRTDITAQKEVEELSHIQKNQLHEIQRFQALTVGREERMIELKEMINELYKEQGKPKIFNLLEQEKETVSPNKEEDLELAEILDINALQKLLDNFCNSVEIASAIIDIKGNILAASRWQKACTHFHRQNEQSCANCLESDIDLSLKLQDGEEFSIYQCKNGLVDCASPIIIEGKHLANVFIGQFLTQKPEIKYFSDQADKFGYDKENYLKAIHEVPIVDEKKLPDILGFLSGFTKIITLLSMEKINASKADKANQQVKLAALNLAEDAQKAQLEVEHHKANLEVKIEERTQELNDERNFVNSVMNSQNNIVISTNGKTIISANKAFLEFYEVSTIDAFHTLYGECICDTFDKNASSEYIQKFMGDETWVEYICARPEVLHKTIIIQKDKHHTFAITADTFSVGEEELKTAVFTDITELEAIQKNVELILSNILLPVLVTSKKERKIIYANKYAQIQYEKSLEELIGSSIDDIYTMQGQHKHILEALESKGYVENFEEVFKTSTGKEFTALLSVTPIIYQEEEAYIGMVTDITKQKEMEKEIRTIHRHTTESIEYASLIQHALIPSNDLFHKYFSDYLTIWHPKDIVGGDLYLFEELRHENECLLTVFDCTGHGVPGAFVTMLVKAIERQITGNIMNSNEIVSPAKILSIFNRSMKHLLKQEDEDSISNAGFDGAILYYNKSENIIKFSGAGLGLFVINDGVLEFIKGDRHSIGYKKSDANFIFTDHTIEIKSGMQFYITTDGYIDQTGGEQGFSFGKKRFAKLLQDHGGLPFADQQEVLLYEMLKYRNNEEKTDDVTVIGLKI